MVCAYITLRAPIICELGKGAVIVIIVLPFVGERVEILTNSWSGTQA